MPQNEEQKHLKAISNGLHLRQEFLGGTLESMYLSLQGSYKALHGIGASMLGPLSPSPSDEDLEPPSETAEEEEDLEGYFMNYDEMERAQDERQRARLGPPNEKTVVREKRNGAKKRIETVKKELEDLRIFYEVRWREH